MKPWLRPLWHGLVAAARLGVAVAPAGGGKLAQTFATRRDLARRIATEGRRRDPARPLVWLHAPSVGEGLQARPVLEALRRAHPDWQLAYTWFSPSAAPFAQRLDVDLRAELPFDGEREMDALLDAWRPTVLAFVKLDVWPVLARRASARGVRTALVSATLAANSGRQGRLARALLGDAYAALDAVGAISPDDGTRLVALGVRPAHLRITGDTRMDQVWARARAVTANHPVHRLLAISNDGSTPAPPLLVAGSTWPADEAVLLPALGTWLNAHATARCIVAPHEPTPEHLAPIEQWAQRAGFPLQRLSAAERSHGSPWRVLLVDRVGVLGDLYALGSFAFVGGGFHDAGLHSVLEPAAFGLPVLFGPQHRNAREAGLLVHAGGAVAVTSEAALLAQLEQWTTEAGTRHCAGAAARAFVEANLGGTARVMAMLEPLVSSGEP